MVDTSFDTVCAHEDRLRGALAFGDAVQAALQITADPFRWVSPSRQAFAANLDASENKRHFLEDKPSFSTPTPQFRCGCSPETPASLELAARLRGGRAALEP